MKRKVIPKKTITDAQGDWLVTEEKKSVLVAQESGEDDGTEESDY